MWLTLDQVRERWIDAPVDDDELTSILEAAQEQCLAFLNLVEAPATPARQEALLLQARNLWRAVHSDADGNMGTSDYPVMTFPLDWHVRALLRPRRAVPVVA